MKKLTAILLIISMITMTFVLASCGDSADKENGGDGSNKSGGTTMTGDELYSEIDALMGNPTRDTKLTGQFTFTAKILSEAFDITFEAENEVHKYIEACIARNDDDTLFIEVDDFSESSLPEPGKIVKVTGTVTGSVYWTEDGKQIDILDIKGVKFTPFTDPEPKVNEGPSITLPTYYTTGEYTFLGAHLASTHTNNVVVIYFNFKNIGDKDDAPLTKDFYAYHGDNYVESIYGEPDEVLSNALPASTGGTQKTYVGKTTLYYMTVRAHPDSEPGDPVWIVLQDDDFFTTADIMIPVAESFEEYTAE